MFLFITFSPKVEITASIYEATWKHVIITLEKKVIYESIHQVFNQFLHLLNASLSQTRFVKTKNSVNDTLPWHK